MKARKILNICAILTLLVLLLCFLFFSYTIIWSTHYWNGSFFAKEEYDSINSASFNGMTMISYSPLRGAVLIILLILNLILCFSSLLSKKKAPDPLLHVVLPTVTGIYLPAYTLFFFWTVESTIPSIMSMRSTLGIPEEAKIALDTGYKAKVVFLIILMLIYIVLCFVKRSQRFFETETPIAAPVYAAPTTAVPQAPIHTAPAPAAAPQPPVRPAPVPPAGGSETPTAQPKAPAAANGAAPRRPAAPPNFKNLPPDFIKTPPKDINYYYELLQKGIITQEEFDAKKKQLLDL